MIAGKDEAANQGVAPAVAMDSGFAAARRAEMTPHFFPYTSA